jgi:hypothetical protein
MRFRFLRPASLPDSSKLGLLVLSGLLLALGRYDWDPNSDLAFRAWTLSAYFFLLLLTGAYAAGRAFALTTHRYFWPTLGGASLLLNLPYRWLALDQFFYLANHPLSYGREPAFVPEWLGRGHRWIPWNSTDVLLSALLAIAAAVWLITHRPIRAWSGARAAPNHRTLHFFLLLFAFMTVETWLHLSNRSPYTYITHYEQPEGAHYVSAWTMLPDGRGAVNADFGYFVRLEELFQGNRADTTTLFVRRPFPFYLSSHLSYFLGAYHAFLLLNLALWLTAAVAMFHFCRDLTGSTPVAASAAGLVACGPGFIMYVAQPMSYLPGYAVLAVAIYLYHRVIVRTALLTPSSLIATGVLLGLTMLTYDTFAWTLFFVGYAVWRRTSLTRVFLTVIIGGLIYAAFLFLIFNVFKFVPEHGNDREIGASLHHLLDLIRHPLSAAIFMQFNSFFGQYCAQVLQVNFYGPVILALLGLFLVSAARAPRLTAFLLLLPSLAGFAFLYFGGSYLAGMPRFNYASYPAVILLAALALGKISESLQARGHARAAFWAMGLPLAACALLANLDAFGFMPHLYFHFYFSGGGNFL